MKYKRLSIILFLLVISGCKVTKAEIDTCETMCKTNGGVKAIDVSIDYYQDCRCNNGMKIKLVESVVKSSNI